MNETTQEGQERTSVSRPADMAKAEAGLASDTKALADTPIERRLVGHVPRENRAGANGDLGPKFSEREIRLTSGTAAREITLTKTYVGMRENYRDDPETSKLDAANRGNLEERCKEKLGTDEAGHLLGAGMGPATGETPAEAAADTRNVNAQSWIMNRGPGSPWSRMERAIFKYRDAHPQSQITVSVTERLTPDKEGSRPISRTVSIIDQNGQIVEELKKWTLSRDLDDGTRGLYFMNPKWQTPPKKRSKSE